MVLEEKVLDLLARGPMTYDGLRAELGVAPGDLDAAIVSLSRGRSITRDRGRLCLPGTAPVNQTAIKLTGQVTDVASPPGQKVCRICGELKPLEEFHKHPASKDGRDPRCKKCAKAKARARYAKREGRSIDAVTVAPVNGPSVAPPAPTAPVMILHFADGVRIGPIVTSAAGLAQMPYHVDLTSKQLDDLVAWHQASKAAAA